MKRGVFKDRAEAGRRLASELLADCRHREDGKDVIVLGLPRGGVVVAREVARALGAPLDVLVVRKLGVPGREELAMGAVASGGVRVIHEQVVRAHHIAPETIEAVAAVQIKELHRREVAYRGHTGAPEVAGRTVILVDDGIATGSTMRSAVQALRPQKPARLIVAVPTAAPDACATLEPLVDELVVLLKSESFAAVGEWYEDFTQTTDAEVRRLLGSSEK